MKVITLESEAFKELVEKINLIANYVQKKESDNLSRKLSEKWLDNDTVANLLKISKRTLQRLRAEKLISYSMLRGRCYYNISDIEKALEERVIICDSKTLNDFHTNYLLYTKQK